MGKYPIINLTLTDYPRMMLKFEMKGLNYTRSSFFHTSHFWFIFYRILTHAGLHSAYFSGTAEATKIWLGQSI